MRSKFAAQYATMMMYGERTELRFCNSKHSSTQHMKMSFLNFKINDFFRIITKLRINLSKYNSKIVEKGKYFLTLTLTQYAFMSKLNKRRHKFDSSKEKCDRFCNRKIKTTYIQDRQRIKFRGYT